MPRESWLLPAEPRCTNTSSAQILHPLFSSLLFINHLASPANSFASPLLPLLALNHLISSVLLCILELAHCTTPLLPIIYTSQTLSLVLVQQKVSDKLQGMFGSTITTSDVVILYSACHHRQQYQKLVIFTISLYLFPKLPWSNHQYPSPFDILYPTF